MYYFTADQHYGHANVIRFCDRPFATVEEMDGKLIRRHNEIVGPDDTVVHAGDFAHRSARPPQSYLEQLNGTHVMVRGSHDRWLGESAREILELKIDGQYVVVCHYAMRTWPRSHYGSWQLHGHSHGTLAPVSFAQICRIMADRPDNPGHTARPSPTGA